MPDKVVIFPIVQWLRFSAVGRYSQSTPRQDRQDGQNCQDRQDTLPEPNAS